eukprot:TRINITY_DN11615_c0_g1_i1.p1 TRINITY_DN11615_c0_g1~~TRINITY_DN11615_c0_g1_i1.p1  ORF type:complete len:464 (+),score=83.85 TRINITY_DN11615_c0_g1_i1:364-1755(+)
MQISTSQESDGDKEAQSIHIDDNIEVEEVEDDEDAYEVPEAKKSKIATSGPTRMTRARRRKQIQMQPNMEAIELSSDSEPDGHEDTRRERAASISPPPQHTKPSPQLKARSVDLNQFAVTAFYFLRPQSQRRLFDSSNRQSRLDIDALRAKSAQYGLQKKLSKPGNAPATAEGENVSGPSLRDLLRFELLKPGDILHSVSKTRFASITASGRIMCDGNLFDTFEDWNRSLGRICRTIVWVKTDGTPLEELKLFYVFMKEESSSVYLHRNRRRVNSLWKGAAVEDILYETQFWFRDDFEAGIEIYKREYGGVDDIGDENSAAATTPRKASRKRKFAENAKEAPGRGRPKKIVKYADDDDSGTFGPEQADRLALANERRAAQEEKKLKKLEMEIFNDLNAIQDSLKSGKSSGRHKSAAAGSDRSKYGTDNGGDPFLDEAFANIPLFPVDDIVTAPPEQAIASLLN